MHTRCHLFGNDPTMWYGFYFAKNKAKSEQFVDCLNLINEISPMGKDVFFDISNQAKTNLSTLLALICAMNLCHIPKDVRQSIILLFVKSEGADVEEILIPRLSKGMSFFNIKKKTVPPYTDELEISKKNNSI